MTNMANHIQRNELTLYRHNVELAIITFKITHLVTNKIIWHRSDKTSCH